MWFFFSFLNRHNIFLHVTGVWCTSRLSESRPWEVFFSDLYDGFLVAKTLVRSWVHNNFRTTMVANWTAVFYASSQFCGGHGSHVFLRYRGCVLVGHCRVTWKDSLYYFYLFLQIKTSFVPPFRFQFEFLLVCFWNNEGDLPTFRFSLCLFPPRTSIYSILCDLNIIGYWYITVDWKFPSIVEVY